MSNIEDVAQSLGIPEEHIELHGKTTAKVDSLPEDVEHNQMNCSTMDMSSVFSVVLVMSQNQGD